ncbi:UNVERIFIED_CONTAM: putative carbohydrate esterase [Sesamum indicum]
MPPNLNYKNDPYALEESKAIVQIIPMEFANTTQKNEAHPTKQIFILSGQSNMAGRGGVDKHTKQWDGVVPPDSSTDSSSIFRLSSQLDWEVAREPLHHDIDSKRTCGVGPGMSFANAVKERVGIVGLVPCAVAGTPIREWARGTYLYESMVNRAKAAASGGEIRALLWYQGEKDTYSQQDAETYKENLERFIQNVREDLNLPSLPIILVSQFCSTL